jgi:hypothetical protein
MYDIRPKENYIYIVSPLTPLGNRNVTDRKSSEVEFVAKYEGSDSYMVRYRGHPIDDLINILWSDFTLNGVPFANQQAFEDWKNENTAGGSGGGGVTPTPVISTNLFPTGLNTSVPAGFRNVTITRLSGTVTIDLGSGIFELGGGSRPRGISVEGDVYGNNTGITPAITITGGTWQWIATNLL